MRTKRIYRAALIAALLVNGCGDTASIAPTGPTGASVPPASPPIAAQGTIQLAAVTHDSGSTLTVHDCGPSWTGIAGNHVCTEEWRGAFDITVERDVSRAVVTVVFDGAVGRCAETAVYDLAFGAGRSRLVSTQHALFLTYEPEGYEHLAVTQRCELPAVTTRVVVSVWDLDGGPGSGAIPVLRREFDYDYQFAQN